ncbi:hypothetical protein HU200_059921 [Digitaria exilis]|uniref:CCHC-type domain-containing protein n=1 Tax=Digitaria exilis TaxID=1010633 RepID=A0A835AAX0_9POAL|nr:hypothetical protein HU200_059921 [Digitaria exilis]
MGNSQDSSQSSSPSEDHMSHDEVNLCFMSKKKRIKFNKGKSQKIEESSSSAKELELLKSNYASLVCKYESLEKDYTCATQSLSCVALYEKSNEMLIAQLDKITTEHKILQANYKELECSLEKLVESYATLDIAHEVVLSSVKSITSLSHQCTCSLVINDISCSNSCCTQARQSSIEHVFVETCDDFITQENQETMQEVNVLKEGLNELDGNGKVQPSQDNRDNMVNKLEERSTTPCSPPQQHLKISKNKVEENNKLEHIKCSHCSTLGHYEFSCPTNLKGERTLSKKKRSLSKKRVCYGHSCVSKCHKC